MFKFRFQKALEHYIDLEKEAERNLVEKNNKIIEIQQKIYGLEKTSKNMKYDLQKVLSGPLNILLIQDYQNYINVKSQEIMKERNLLENLQNEKDQLQEEYFERRKERKTFEKLREQHFEKYKKDEEKKEQKIIDEITNNMYNRR